MIMKPIDKHGLFKLLSITVSYINYDWNVGSFLFLAPNLNLKSVRKFWQNKFKSHFRHQLSKCELVKK